MISCLFSLHVAPRSPPSIRGRPTRPARAVHSFRPRGAGTAQCVLRRGLHDFLPDVFTMAHFTIITAFRVEAEEAGGDPRRNDVGGGE